MIFDRPLSPLPGRERELDAVNEVMSRAAAGRGGALLLLGEQGIGKSALLEHVAEIATSWTVLRAAGDPSERDVPSAGLQMMTDPNTRIRAGHRHLGQAFLDFLTSLAGGEGRVLCLVDDVDWLDRPSTEAIRFAARRIQHERVTILIASRGEPEGLVSGTLNRVWLMPLSRHASESVVEHEASGLCPAERDALLDHSQGNPMALRAMAIAKVLEGDSLVSSRGQINACPEIPLRVTPSAGNAVAARVLTLPDAARRLLLVSAAERSGDLSVIARAAARLGLTVDDLASAERAGLVRITGSWLSYPQPVIPSAVYHSSPVTDRGLVHAALATVMADFGDSWREAVHLAVSTTAPDEEVAGRLVEAAHTVASTGQRSALAYAYERAAELSTDCRLRAARLLAAARLTWDAGCASGAHELTSRIDGSALDASGRARLAETRAALTWQDDQLSSVHQLRAVAEAAGESAAEVADEVAFIAGAADWSAGAAAVRFLGAGHAGPPAAAGVLALHAIAELAEGRPAAAVSALRTAREWLFDAGMGAGRALTHVHRPIVGMLLGDIDAARATAGSLVRQVRVRSEFVVLPFALTTLARADAWSGRIEEAAAGAREAMATAAQLGSRLDVARAKAELVYVAAMRGEEEACDDLAAEADHHGTPTTQDTAACHLALREVGHDRHEAAVRLLRPVIAGPRRHALTAWCSIPDLIEASVAVGEVGEVRQVLAEYESWAEATGEPWPVSTAKRCRALLTEDEHEASSLFKEAIDLASLSAHAFERGRTHLLYGIWLRRRLCTTESRRQLESARNEFGRLGAVPWGRRAERELRAAGESQRSSVISNPLGVLTAQELRVVRLAAGGLSNREIGTRLFLSHRTVGYHLYKAFPKLGVASRHELARLGLEADERESSTWTNGGPR